jgi:DNA-directed RNA polymerase subunit H (RpoH/RPB5)
MAAGGAGSGGVDPTAIRVIGILQTEFLEARGYEPVAPPMNNDAIRQSLRGAGFVRIDGRRKTGSEARTDQLTVAFLYGKDRWKADTLGRAIPQIMARSVGDVVIVHTSEPAMAKVVGALRDESRYVLPTMIYPFAMNPLKNVGTPTQRLVGKEEADEIRKDLHIHSGKSFAQMDATDPAAVWLGGRPGDLVEVVRIAASGPHLAYRIIKDNRGMKPWTPPK